MSENKMIQELDSTVQVIVKDDYIKTVKGLTGNEICCMKASTGFAITAAILTGISSVLAFSAGFFHHEYVSYAAGCTSVLAMIAMKASYYTNSQSHYQDAKLKNHLTKDYRFVHGFITDPLSLHPVNEPGRMLYFQTCFIV